MIKEEDTALEVILKIYIIISLFIIFPIIIARYGVLANNSHFSIVTDIIWYYGVVITFKLIK